MEVWHCKIFNRFMYVKHNSAAKVKGGKSSNVSEHDQFVKPINNRYINNM